MGKVKASDVILEIRNKISNLEYSNSNIDNNYKIVLNKLNHMINLLNAINSKLDESRIDKPAYPYIPNNNERKVVVNQNHQGLISNEELMETNYSEENPLVEATERVGNNRISRVKQETVNPGPKVSVSQLITWNDDRPVFLAHVEIYHISHNESGKPIENLIKRTRTNTKGKWLGAFSPGNYIVRVIKRVDADDKKPPIDVKFPINIEATEGAFNLPSQSIGNPS